MVLLGPSHIRAGLHVRNPCTLLGFGLPAPEETRIEEAELSEHEGHSEV